MVRSESSPKKTEMLREVPVAYLSEPRMELNLIHSEEFREFLRRRGELLEGFLQRLGIKVMANLAQVVAGRLGQFKGRP